MYGERKFLPGMARFSKRKGMFLLEMVITGFLLALAAGITAPLMTEWQEERLLDVAAVEVSAIIRDAELYTRNGEERISGAPERLKLYFTMEGERIRYYSVRGIYQTRPRGLLPDGVRLGSQTVSLEFQKSGFSGQSDDLTFYLMTKDRKRARKLVVAMYTGRVRIEKAW